uniref:Uncharacterized protein n=1 Tax=viral metagenome TaxID=1070528 RepID=A0A6M3LXP6_9ZZZZ
MKRGQNCKGAPWKFVTIEKRFRRDGTLRGTYVYFSHETGFMYQKRHWFRSYFPPTTSWEDIVTYADANAQPMTGWINIHSMVAGRIHYWEALKRQGLWVDDPDYEAEHLKRERRDK